jgi:hypothetical protein
MIAPPPDCAHQRIVTVNRRALWAACFIAALSATASAEQVKLTPRNLLDLARTSITSGRLDDADKLLAAVREDLVDRNDLDFLRGTLALAHKDYNKAITAFRSILTRDPSLNRVRLDLARALFLNGDYAIAEYHFRVAEAAGLPPGVQANVDKFLNEIKRRKHWSVDVTVGVQPDTNVNAATAVKTVNLFGTPYQLDQNAQKTSGVGFVGGLAGSYQLDMTDNSRLVMGGNLNDTDYAGRKFDDQSVGAFVGPRFLIGAVSEVTVEATSTRRWYGGQDYYWGVGGRVEGKTSLSPRWLLTGSIDVQKLTYDMQPLQTGPVTTVSSGVTYGIDAVSFVRMDGALIHEQTREQAFRDTQYFFGPTYYREFSHGFGVNLGVNVDFARYDAPLAAFDTTRRDTTVNYQVGVSNRNVNLFGFMPVVTYIHTSRYSDIPLYAFDRDRVTIGATQNF